MIELSSEVIEGHQRPIIQETGRFSIFVEKTNVRKIHLKIKLLFYLAVILTIFDKILTKFLSDFWYFIPIISNHGIFLTFANNNF